MLRLVAIEKKVESASVPIRWCIDEVTKEKIKSKKIEKPYLLLVVLPKHKPGERYSQECEKRWILPLDEMVQYVSFCRPGDNLVFATIVWNNNGKYGWEENSLNDLYLRKERGLYKTDVINFEGILHSQVEDSSNSNMEHAELEVIVPEGLFAKEPPEWEKKWVNWLFDKPATDQCHYRKRRIFAYTIQPIIGAFYLFLLSAVLSWKMGVVMPVRIITTLFFLLIGLWSVNFKPLIHPFSCSTGDIWEPTKNKPNTFGIWINKGVDLITVTKSEIRKEEEWKRHQKLMSSKTEKEKAKNKQLRERMSAKIEKRIAKNRRIEEENQAYFDARLEILSCDKLDVPPISLVSNTRKVYLLFCDLKTKVCRPFAR